MRLVQVAQELWINPAHIVSVKAHPRDREVWVKLIDSDNSVRTWFPDLAAATGSINAALAGNQSPAYIGSTPSQ